MSLAQTTSSSALHLPRRSHVVCILTNRPLLQCTNNRASLMLPIWQFDSSRFEDVCNPILMVPEGMGAGEFGLEDCSLGSLLCLITQSCVSGTHQERCSRADRSGLRQNCKRRTLAKAVPSSYRRKAAGASAPRAGALSALRSLRQPSKRALDSQVWAS